MLLNTVYLDLRPEEGQSIWSKRRQGFQPCFEAGIRELPFLMPEPAEKPSLHTVYLQTL